MTYQCGIFAVLQQYLDKICRANKSDGGMLFSMKFKYVEVTD